MSGSYDAFRRSRVATTFVILTLILAVLPLDHLAPVAAQDTATYTLTKYNCNPNYDLSSGDANAAFSNCTTPASGVTFTLQSGDASYGNNGAQQTNGGGSASWSGIPLGTGYSIVESIPNGGGDPWVYCEISGNPNNDSDVQTSFFQATGGNMDVGYSDPNLTSYTQAKCSWFNPSTEQSVQGQQPSGTGSAVVHIQKYICDPSHDYSSSNYSDYQTTCSTVHGGVKFTVNGGTPSLTGNSDGAVEFGSLPSGQAQIRLSEPSGYSPLALYCVDWDPSQYGSPTLADNNKTTWTDEGNSSYRVDTTLTDNHTYYCYWFDVPSGSGTLYLYKYYCAPDYDWQSAGYTDLLSGCASPQSDVQFQVENGSYSEQQTTGSDGTATWTDVPDGNLQLSEQAPSGYQIGRIFCGYSDTQNTPPTSWDEYSYSDGWSVPTQTGQYLYCVVFDVPSSYGTVYLYKYYCAPDFDWQNGAYDYLFSGCQNPQSDVYFEIHNGSYSQGETTDSQGSAAWDNVPGGDLEIVEQTPSGYTVGRVFCGTSSDANTPPSSLDETSYSEGIHVPITSGQYLYCVYFNIPTTYGTVYFYKYYCDASFDWQNGQYDYLHDNCTNPQEGVQFDLTSGSYASNQSTDSQGTASWTDAPQGDLNFVEKLPEGYQVGRIFCGYSDTDGTPPTSWDEYTYSDGWTVPNPSGQYVYCYIFNVPTTNWMVHLYKYYCDASFDWQNGSYDYLSTGCTNPQEGIQFDLSNGSYFQSQTTDSSGAATWTDVPQDTWDFQEHEPDGYQVGRIFCGFSDTDGTPPSSLDEYSYSDGWSVDNASSTYLYCYIFDIPTTYGTIHLYKYYCDASFDWQNGSYDYLANGCQNAQSDVDFDLSSGSYAETQTTDSNGTATWSDAPEGNWHFVEHFPDGYQVGRIFCGYSDTDGTPPTSWDEYSYSDGWDVSSSSGQYLYCYIFDIPTTYWTVYFYKYYCEASFDWQNGSYDYLANGCQNAQPDVQFDVNSGSYSESQTTDSNGLATWTDVPQGNWHFDEQFPDGYQVGRIFCGYSDTDGTPPTSWDEYSYSDGWDVSGSSGKYLYCYIFDVPVTYGTVYFYKYYCAADYDWQSGGYDELHAGCTSPQENVDFSLDSGSYSETQTTDSSGAATWSDVPQGSWSFSESIPDGYQVGRIFCGYSDTDGTPPTSWDEYTYADGWDVDGSAQPYLYCYIFDVPQQYGWVTIYKYTCPADFDYSSADQSYYESSCTDQPEGIDFEVSNPSYGYQEDQSTDSSGTASWSDVPSGGGLSIYELPNGFAPIAVWCGSSTDDSDPTSWDQYTLAADGGLGGLTLDPNTYFFCKWYNKPYDNPQVWIYKYNCEQSADWHWNYHQLLSGCTTPASGVEFASGQQSGSPTQNATDDQGKGHWTDLAPGTWYWEESFPSGYDGALVYCQWVNSYGSGEYQQAQLDVAKLWLVLDPGDVVTCYWFDFPSGYGPPVATPTSGGSGGSSGGSSSGSSSGGGGTSGGTTSGGNTSGGTGGGTTSGAPPLTSNVPKSPGGGGAPAGGTTTGQQGNPNAPATLVITKSTCPKGYDIYADKSDVAKDCKDLTKDIDFALTSLTSSTQNGTPTAASPVKQTTGDDGKATWTNLKAGPYLIAETLPDGTGAAFIWTCKSDKRQFQTQYPFTPFSYAGPNGQLGITLIGGEKLECTWYDIPAAPATVTIHKFECPSSPVIVAQCDPAAAGVQFSLAPAEGVGAIIQLTTDDSGNATGDGVEGPYTLAEQGGTPCLIDSDAVDEQGHITLSQDQPAEVKVYNCGGGGS